MYSHLDNNILLTSFTYNKAIPNRRNPILPDDPHDSYFIPGGRNFFSGISLYLLHQNINTSFTEIINAILLGNAIEWVKTIKYSDCPEAQACTNGYYGSNEKNVSGCYGVCTQAVRSLTFGGLGEILNSDGDCISPKVLEAGYDIYIEIPQDKIKIFAPITTILIQNFIKSFMSRTDSSSEKIKRPIIMLLDEFPQLGFDFDILSEGMATLRSKGVTFFLAQQSISQISKRYGQDGFREIMDQCAYITVMSAQDPYGREYFSKLIGNRKTLKVSTSKSEKKVTRSVSESEEPVFAPEVFSNLGETSVIYANGKYIQATKTNCWE